MADISKIDDVAIANIDKIMARTKTDGDGVMGILVPSVAAGIIESIQQIEFTIASSSATGTSTITSVDTAKTALFFSYGHFGGRRQTDTEASMNAFSVRVDLTNATTVTAVRDTGPGFVITVICTVVEYKSTAVDSVQQGTITLTVSDTSNTDTITSVNTARSAVIFNGTTAVTVGGLNGAVLLDVALTNATTVTVTRNLGNVQTPSANYVVIEFATGIVDSVQEFSITIADSGATTNTATITSVDTARSVIFPGGQKSNVTNTQIDEDVAYVELTNATTVTITREVINASEPAVTGTVVEFSSGKLNSVQRGVDTIASGSLSEDITVTSVDTSLSVVNALGTSSVNAQTFDPEEQTFTIEILNATTLRATRNVTGRDVIFPWEVTEYAS